MSNLYCMDNVKKIHNKRNETIEQIKDLITSSFPPVFKYKVLYYEGTDMDTKNRLLVFEIESEEFGSIYRKSVIIHPLRSVDEYEHDFIGKLLSDFVMLGTTYLTNSIIQNRVSKKEHSENVLINPYGKGRFEGINLN